MIDISENNQIKLNSSKMLKLHLLVLQSGGLYY